MRRKIHTARPKRGGARIAWDYFSSFGHAEPVEMWFTHLDYPCWVAVFPDGTTEDVDNLELADKRQAARRAAGQ